MQSDTLQIIVVSLIVAAAVASAVMRLRRTIRSKGAGSCSSCGLKEACTHVGHPDRTPRQRPSTAANGVDCKPRADKNGKDCKSDTPANGVDCKTKTSNKSAVKNKFDKKPPQ